MKVSLQFQSEDEKQILASFIDTSKDTYETEFLGISGLRRLGILLRCTPPPTAVEQREDYREVKDQS